MATIRKRGKSWQAQIRLADHRPQSKIFLPKQQLSNGVIEETQRDNCMDLLFECFATNQVRRRQNIVLCNQYLPLDLGFHCLSRVLECCGVRNSSSRSSCLA